MAVKRWLFMPLLCVFLLASCASDRMKDEVAENVPLASANAESYQYQETRDLVRFVDEAVDAIHREGEAVFPAFRREGSRWLQGERYVFVWDLEGDRYVYPPDLAHEKGNQAQLKDIDGKPIGRMFIEAAAGPGGKGWVHYRWYKPGDPEPTWKSTYIKRAEAPDGMTYLVGSGVYNMRVEPVFVIHTVEEAAALLQREGREGFDTLRDKSSPFFYYNTYVFVTSPEGVELVNPAFPSLEGRLMIDTRDARGKLLVKNYIEAAQRRGSAWVSYYWPRPGTREPVRKLTYVKRVLVGNEYLIVGSGIYEE